MFLKNTGLWLITVILFTEQINLYKYERLLSSLWIFRLLVREARRLAANYHMKYEEPIPTSQLVQKVATVMQEYTQQG